MIDEWSGFANLMANLIAKYAAELDLDSLPDPERKAQIDSNEESPEVSRNTVEVRLSA